MVRLIFTSTLVAFLATLALSAPQPITPDPNGAKNLGNGAGTQFITGACLSNADCASGCCASIVGSDGTQGICSGTAVGNVNGKGGCGFGSAGASPPVASPSTPPPSSGDATTPDAGGTGGACPAVSEGLAGSQNVGKGNGQQFITGQCQSAADCASGCCSLQADGTAQCRARIVTEQGGGSCDFSCSAGKK